MVHIRKTLIAGSATLALCGCMSSGPRDTATDVCITPLASDALNAPASSDKAHAPNKRYQAAKQYFAYAAMSNNVYMRHAREGRSSEWSDDRLIPLGPEWIEFCEPDEKQERTNPVSQEKIKTCYAEDVAYGFQAKTYIRLDRSGTRPDTVVFAFRGTTSNLDWLFGNLLSTQYALADFYVRSMLRLIHAQYHGVLAAPANVNVVATGHSLGGALAEHVARCFSQFDIVAVTFDTSPRLHGRHCAATLQKSEVSGSANASEAGPAPRFRAQALNDDGRFASAKVIHIRQHDEVASLLRALVPDDGHYSVRYDFEHGGPVALHSIHHLAIGMLKVASCSAPTEAGSGEARQMLVRACGKEREAIAQSCMTISESLVSR